MIEVVTWRDGRLIDRAEADDPASAIVAARVLWEEAQPGHFTKSKVTVGFYVDGRLVRQTEGRP